MEPQTPPHCSMESAAPSSLNCAVRCRRLRERNEQRQQEKEEREAALHEEVARQRAEISNAKEESFRWGSHPLQRGVIC